MHRDHLHMDLEILQKTDHRYLKDEDGPRHPSCSASMICEKKKYGHYSTPGNSIEYAKALICHFIQSM